MNPGDGSEQPGEVRVTDRRRFTETGDSRESEDSVAARAAAPSRETAAPSRETVLDLGIEAIFYVFYQSSLIALGAPEAGGEPREPDLVDARQAIDFLRILEEKTAGNLSPAEVDVLRQLLDDAQLRFVHVAKALSGGGA